jgi:glycosyltransferase involved in cell wall biosynthesis
VEFDLVGPLDTNPAGISIKDVDGWQREGIVNFHGLLDDIRPVMRQASVYVLPSYREGTPRTALEAMAMGRPVITTDAPGCRETVRDGENGYLVPVKDIGALANAMERFISQPSLVPEMGRRGREIAEERYDVHKVNEVLIRELGVS